MEFILSSETESARNLGSLLIITGWGESGKVILVGLYSCRLRVQSPFVQAMGGR